MALDINLNITNTAYDKHFSELKTQLKTMANSIKDLTAQVGDLQSALDAEQEQIKAAIDKLDAAIADLNTKVTEGGTSEERDALAAKLTEIKSDLQGTIPDEPTDPGTGGETGGGEEPV